MCTNKCTNILAPKMLLIKLFFQHIFHIVNEKIYLVYPLPKSQIMETILKFPHSLHQSVKWEGIAIDKTLSHRIVVSLPSVHFRIGWANFDGRGSM